MQENISVSADWVIKQIVWKVLFKWEKMCLKRNPGGAGVEWISILYHISLSKPAAILYIGTAVFSYGTNHWMKTGQMFKDLLDCPYTLFP